MVSFAGHCVLSLHYFLCATPSTKGYEVTQGKHLFHLYLCVSSCGFVDVFSCNLTSQTCPPTSPVQDRSPPLGTCAVADRRSGRGWRPVRVRFRRGWRGRGRAKHPCCARTVRAPPERNPAGRPGRIPG